MRYFIRGNSRVFENARFLLEKLVCALPGNDMVIIADAESYANARALCDVALEMDVHTLLIDIDHYRDEKGFYPVPVMQPLRQAILHSDIALMVVNQKLTNFGRLLGNRDETDKFLLKNSRRYTLEANGMEAWRLDADRIFRDRERAERLFAWLQKAGVIHIATKRGTDLTCLVGNRPDGMYPVLSILPFYSEVAVVPALNTVNGVVMADGASEYAYHHRGFPIRPAIPGYQELWREPLCLTFKGSVLVGYEGDPVQTARLDALLNTADPKPDLCDEVAVVTCTSNENDQYGWLVDGSHQTHCCHIALGNNRRRGEIIHSTEHVDFDIHQPVISVDGQVIYKDGSFLDDVIWANG